MIAVTAMPKLTEIKNVSDQYPILGAQLSGGDVLIT